MSCRFTISPCAARVAVALAAVAGLAAPAVAGPPLLCHPFDIGTARSLPWTGAESWRAPLPGYPLGHLEGDTLALLTPSTPVIVRMETLRRAAIYASGRVEIARSLVASLVRRARAAEDTGRTDALADLDAAYLVEAVRELADVAQYEHRGDAPRLRALVQGIDGYALVTRSLAVRPGEPAIEFAAALIASDRHRDAYFSHAEKARVGANQDPLLARNIDHVR